MIPDRVGWDLGHKADMGTQPGPCNLREGHREQPRKESGLGERPGIKGQGEGRRVRSPSEGNEAGRAQLVFARIHSCLLNGFQKRQTCYSGSLGIQLYRRKDSFKALNSGNLFVNYCFRALFFF